MLDNNDFREEFKSSKGLCIPHFTSVIRMTGQIRLKNPAGVTQTLIEAEIKNLELTEHYLLEFLRKRSWNYRNEPPGPEINGNAMVLGLLVGAEGFSHRSYNAISLSKD